jgi:CheY-like chemotaxis protein/two-component sensor histidine kinase
MGLLLDDLLDVSRITRGTLQLRRERVELAAIVDTAIETARPLLDERRHQLVLELPRTAVWLEVDALRIAQVLANLLTNAAKYSESGGCIELLASVAGNELVLRVTDTGIGIEAEMLPRIFEMFSQSAHAIERSQGGLGIGLALVKGLVELHDGTVEAASDGPGRGSRFTVRLPQPADPGLDASPHVAQAESRDGQSAGVSHRMLIVDDNRDSAESLAMVLRLSGHDTHCAHDGESAIELAAALRPTHVLLDIGMPNLNGYETARRMRQHDWGRAATLVAITGWGQPEDRRRAFDAGFDHHLVKPINLADLQRILSSCAD